MLSSPRRIQFVFLMVTIAVAGQSPAGWDCGSFNRTATWRASEGASNWRRWQTVLPEHSTAAWRNWKTSWQIRHRAGIPAGAVLVRGFHDGMEARPADALLYYPVLAPAPEPPPASLSLMGAFEFLRNDPARTAAVFRPATRSPSTAVRAAALVRLGGT